MSTTAIKYRKLSWGIIKLIYLPLLILSVGDLLTWQPASSPVYALALAMILTGLYGMATAGLLMFRFGEGGIHFSKVPERLVDVGLYARNRHPSFWFFLLFQAGMLLLFLGFQWISLILFLTILLTGTLYLTLVEVPQIHKVLGESYTSYSNETPFWSWTFKLAEDRKVRLLAQLIWLVGRSVFRYWYGIKVKGSEHIPHHKPFLVIANHESFLDPFFFGTFIPYELRFVTTADVFSSVWMRFLLRGIGTFPMRRHRQDLKSIRTMIRLVTQDQVVGIFPEGGRSLYGEPLPILKETLKLIQRCKVPILPVHLNGAYEVWPRWAPNRRRGAVSVSINPIIPVEEQSDLHHLESRIGESIFANNKSFTRVSTRAIAKGMDNVLWACKKCYAFNAIQVTSGSGIRCKKCSSTWEVTLDYAFVDEATHESYTIIEWMHSIEADMLKRAPLPDTILTLEPEERPYLFSPLDQYHTETDDPIYEDLSLYLTDRRIILGHKDQILHSYDLDSITVFTMDYYNAVSIGVSGIRHSFHLPAGDVSLKWQTFYDMLKLKRAE